MADGNGMRLLGLADKLSEQFPDSITVEHVTIQLEYIAQSVARNEELLDSYIGAAREYDPTAVVRSMLVGFVLGSGDEEVPADWVDGGH